MFVITERLYAHRVYFNVKNFNVLMYVYIYILCISWNNKKSTVEILLVN
jgi:hypothetical protein